MTSDLSHFTLSGLSGEDDAPIKTSRVVVGGERPVSRVQDGSMSQFDERIGYDDAFDRHSGQGQQKARGHVIEDTEWEEYQRLKAEAAARGNSDAWKSNMPTGKPGTTRVVVDEAPDMPPTGYPVGLNGRCYIIRPGEPVDLPLPVLEIIKNAVISKPILDKNTKQVIGYRDAPRIPWRYAA